MNADVRRAGKATVRGAGSRQADLPRRDEQGRNPPADAREVSRLLFLRLHELDEGTPGHSYARNTLIEMHLSLVHYTARRFRRRDSEDMEDVVQVGIIGLIKAIDRFDLSRETELTSFAIPYISGEIKRFFRDTTWAVHVPRRLQELRTELAKAKETLAVRLDRDATIAELADFLHLTEAQVTEGVLAASAYTAHSLDLPVDSSGGDGSESAGTHADFVGAPDRDIELFENLHSLAPLLAELSDRDRRLLTLRFGHDLSQAEIGRALGISQMQVSRLLARVLSRLRAGMHAHD
ncbi:SigB/SigF/SigG family RNA polymerase sigma factor [Streptomyces sp. NPDC088745]|uniref:SigB/SigF/SigG family RNA polymerase sigma factor n=1 Tax=Streptomyces sp. NPDC088745 TaxID=3365884 RepID=UPI003827A0F7